MLPFRCREDCLESPSLRRTPQASVYEDKKKKRSSYKNCGKMFGKVLLLRLGLKGFYEEENGKILL